MTFTIVLLTNYSVDVIAQQKSVQCGCCSSGGSLQTSPILLALDLDKDGIISAVEIKNAAQSLSALDSDGDGLLSRVETQAGKNKKESTASKISKVKNESVSNPMYPMMSGFTRAHFADTMLFKFDADDNGQLELTEMSPPLQQMLPVVDPNKDDILTRPELLRLMDRFVRRPRQPLKRGR
ncbi:MAG: hypothetical protein AAGA30_11370 [Planctomycetota bacterium]